MTHKIANYPGVPEELSGEELLGRMKEQAEGFARELLNILSKY
jgi:thioredoxin reductase (NADPH)